ncbi:Amino acid transporter [Lactococcus sp. DD01]|nr:Amino acid transporter [Lactococcus sp. DD01]
MFGTSGILSEVSLIFLAYIRFDSISANAVEIKNPKRAIPLGIVLFLHSQKFGAS